MINELRTIVLHSPEESPTLINHLVYKFTKQSLHTTKEAREKLCEKSGNLFMLKTLPAELVTHVNDEKRNWVNCDDTVKIVEELKKSLVCGHRQEIAQYLRAVLNDSEDVNFWKPRPCYPLAVALAMLSEDT